MKKLLILIASACLVGLAGCAFSVDFDLDDFDNAKYSSRTVDISTPVDNLEINWPYGDVKCVEHDGNNVEFYETSSKKITEYNSLTYDYYSGSRTLVINYYNDSLRRGEIVQNKQLIVFVPKNKYFDCARMNGCRSRAHFSEYVKVRIQTIFFDGELDIADNYSK